MPTSLTMCLNEHREPFRRGQVAKGASIVPKSYPLTFKPHPANSRSSILVPLPEISRYRSPKDTPATPRLGALFIDFSRIIPRTFRIQLVRVLKSLRKPFALWPFIAAFARPSRTVARHGSGRAH